MLEAAPPPPADPNPNALEYTMSTKKPTSFLAGLGACALAVAGCSSPSSQAPTSGAEPSAGSQQSEGCSGAQSGAGSADPTLPVGDADTALTPKGGQSGSSATAGDEAPSVIIIVHLDDGADRAATLASINEAVAAAFPGASVTVEREYKNALQGFALRAPAGSLEAIRSASGVKAAFVEGETRVQSRG